MKIVIVGAGKLGLNVAASLISSENYITLIDVDAAVIQKANNQMDLMAITGNGLQFDVYSDIKIHEYDYLLALTDNDEKNLVICSIAKSLGCKRVIARLRDPEYTLQLEFIKQTFKVDHIINPDKLISYEIFNYLLNHNEDYNQFFTGTTIGMIEVQANAIPGIIGTKVLNASYYIKGMLILSISRRGKIIIPKSHVTVEKNDILYLLGSKQNIALLTSSITTINEESPVKKVMILGGGKTGLYLSQLLNSAGISVKIIERDRARCEYLSQHIDDILILHGDATDVSLLQEENISSMDAVITATGYDEDNIILSLMAQQYGIKEVIAKISRGNYSTLTEKIGVNTIMNTLEITTSFILRIVQSGNFVASSFFLQGQAEVLEVRAVESMFITDKKLKDLSFPDGSLVAVIFRDGKAIVPDGNTQILNNDRIIFFCLLSDIPELERLIQSTKKRFFRI